MFQVLYDKGLLYLMPLIKYTCVLLLVVCGSQSFRLVMIEHVTYDESYTIKDCLAGESSRPNNDICYHSFTFIEQNKT